ncbi:MAG TPA: serine/threonine-protein kinase [Planctomycetota bacterium]|nr:serine/threonine-protein kinase [Planctomycetota bacterium]
MDASMTRTTISAPESRESTSTRTQLESALRPFEIVRKLGQGAAGDVYEVADPASRVHYVVKTLRSEVRNAIDVLRFRREAHFMAKLHHPNIMPVIRVALDADPPRYMMPLYDGQTLNERRREPMDLAFVLRTARDICYGLAAAHRFGIIHRDVKPANVFLENGERAILMDFGLSKRADCDEGLTAAHALLGTPGYMAPEQWLGDRVTLRIDVYALGVTVTELLIGANPFATRTLIEALERHTEARPRRLDTLMPGRVPVELGELLERMLAKKPENRPKTDSCLETLAGITRQVERQRSRPVFDGVDETALRAFFARGN